MIKYLECPDLHYEPGKLTDIGKTIAEAARTNEVDFIALPGDLYDAPIMATDKGGINELRRIVRSWLDICPVVAIEGTPSHDGPGCYGPLEDMGLTLLKPGKVYGYVTDIQGKQRIIERLIDGAVLPTTKCILFGVPELNKKQIQSQLNLLAEQANAEAVNLFTRYVAEFIAPMRMKYQDIPAIALLHGVVSDSRKENTTDVIIKASDIVIHTEDLRPANIDRWSLGHIHKPWESSEICAGYAGSWGRDWTELGFKPGMNIVEIDYTGIPTTEAFIKNGELFEETSIKHVRLSRIPYGTPERRKIIHPLSSYDQEIAYLLETDDPDATIPTGHPLSELRYKPKPKETRRVTKEQADLAQTLQDIFKLFDPEAPETAIKKLDEIIEKVKQRSVNPIDVQLQYVKIDGCIFFKGQNVEFDLTNIDGVTELHGEGNGVGKSGLLAFCSPYPVVIGKDTDSGRASAIKDFFDTPDSLVIKKLSVNGVLHEHIITIKGAHTQTPKVECYLTIDGKPQLDKGTFDEMYDMCEKLYGPYLDYLLTTFYVQPLQGTTGSSLMSAKLIDIRNLVQSIAGIDRESEKEYALNKVGTLKKESDDLTNWLKGAEEFKADISALAAQIAEKQKTVDSLSVDIEKNKSTGIKIKKKLEEATENKTKSDSEALRQVNDKNKILNIDLEISNKNKSIEQLKQSASTIEANRQKLKDDDILRQENMRIEKLQSDYGNKSSEIRTKITNEQSRIENDKNKIANDIEIAKKNIESYTNQRNQIDKPCVNCGYISPDVKEKIEQLEIKQKEETKQLDFLQSITVDIFILNQLQADLKNLVAPQEAIKPMLSTATREQLSNDIQIALESDAMIKSHTARIDELENEKSVLQKNVYDIDEFIADIVKQLNDDIEALHDKHTELSKQKAQAEAEIKSIDELIVKARENEKKIQDAELKIKKLFADIEDWQYLAKMFQPAKLPAFELELVIDAIDTEASRIIEPYYSAKYSFSTETQQQGKKSTVDKFDIQVHDAETGRATSFVKFNPGTKAFLNDAYVKALIKQRNERFKRNYSPIILDEADEPIHPGSLECFYNMQRNYFTDSKVIVVSHSPASHEHIENTVYME